MNLALEQYQTELEDLCRRYHVRRLELFGSAVRGRGNAVPNDLDFLVEFQPLPEGRYADAFFGLMESLENLFQKPVDLVVPSAIKNPYFRQSVEATKKLLYAVESKKYLFDIEQAAMQIATFTEGKSFDDYRSDAMMRSAVERQFEIVGEALSRLARIDEELTGKITEFQRIISFRNILIHGYAQVDDRLVWDVIHTKLPALRREVHELLGSS